MAQPGSNGFALQTIGCAMKVHNTLGNGFQEMIYQRCLAIELRKAGLDFMREKEQPIFYEGEEVGTRRAHHITGQCLFLKILIETLTPKAAMNWKCITATTAGTG